MRASSEVSENIRDRVSRHKNRRMGVAKQKVLLLLAGGLALGLSGSPRTSWKVIGAMTREWRKLNRQSAERAINSLYASKLIAVQERKDGTFSLTLSEDGKKRVLTYNLLYMKVRKPKAWDKKWRLVSFDIPEVKRVARDAFRKHLLRLGFYEQHQSFLVFPFDCNDELEYLIELHDIRKYVRRAVAVQLDGESELKKFFNLS